MSTTRGEDLERLVAEHRAKVEAVRQEPGLSWEQRERQVRHLGLRYDEERRQLEEETA
jgi:hypothetical protein